MESFPRTECWRDLRSMDKRCSPQITLRQPQPNGRSHVQ